MTSNYDDPYNQAKRLLTLFKDRPWAALELAQLVPDLLEEIDSLRNKECQCDE